MTSILLCVINMKTVVYITKNKIWSGEQVYDWDGVSMDEVFGKIKKENKVGDIRVVLGNDISYVTAVKAGDTFLTRENVLKMVKSWMPFEIDGSCFDWKQIQVAYDETWIQVIALEKELLMSLSSAIKKNGFNVDLITSIGILLGKKSEGRESPVIIKWSNKENLSVLAINGMVDLAVSDNNGTDLMSYAKHKWNLAVNPEEIRLRETEFNLSENVFSEKTKGEDRYVLNLPLLKGMVGEIPFGGQNIEEQEVAKVIEEKKPVSFLWIFLIFIGVVLITVVVGIIGMGSKKLFLPSKKEVVEATVPSPSPTVEVTPEPVKVDLSLLKVQVLNGSGVTGEAAGIKKELLDMGFKLVDIGNTSATTEGKILFKSEVPESVYEIVLKSVLDYKMGDSGNLADDDSYDMKVVIGSATKQ